MAKSINILGTQYQDPASKGIFKQAGGIKKDLIGSSGAAVSDTALLMVVQVLGEARGHVSLKLFQHDGSETAEIFQRLSLSQYVVTLQTNVGAAAAGAAHDVANGRIDWILDEATFRTGRLELTMSGSLGGDEFTPSVNVIVQGLNGTAFDTAVTASYAKNGHLPASLPFESFDN
jgi:hypothetical protein